MGFRVQLGIDRLRMGLLACGFLLLALAGSVQAVVVDRLYDAVVPVEDTGTDVRQEAFREALRQVLLRLTGDPARVQRMVPDDTGGEQPQEALGDHAARFIEAFSYRRNGKQLELHATLSTAAVGQALADRQVPVWGATRPRILLWFLVDGRGERKLIHRDNILPPFLEKPMQPLDSEALAAERGPWKEPLWETSRQRGMPLALPFNDDRDRAQVGLSEIWGLFQEPIRRASRRYPHDVMAIARVNRDGDGWRARWQLRRGDDRIADGVTRANDRADVAQQLVNAWADQLAGRYAVAPASGEALRSARMLIADVEGLGPYAAVRQSLAGLEPIRSVQIDAIHQDRLTLELAFNGDLRLLLDYIGLDERMVLMGGPPDGAIPSGSTTDGDALRLYYRWDQDRAAIGMGPGSDEAQEIVPLDSAEEGSGGSAPSLQ
ncbi:DUF2066 domain-containing protein [Salicola sp. Rm-C-2C1-2]|uniref:DUF2066 domain-containing protein n=1 Tax=Salicola sp. Rm-C-2C1-2 TaxID=3141321 RepID=UPI0032E42018